MNHKQDGELSFFVFSFNDLSYTLNAMCYTLEIDCPEVFLDARIKKSYNICISKRKGEVNE